MTPAELRAALATRLDGLLGTYARPGTTTVPALYVGEPPSDWLAAGLEARIEPHPDLDLTRVHSGTRLTREYRVRLVDRGDASTNAMVAAERVAQSFDTSPPVAIPANERLGIPQQYTLTIRS